MKNLALIVTLLVSPAVLSETTTPITLGSINQAPWAWLDNKQQLHGATIDFAKLLELRLGIAIKPQIYPYARLLRSMKNQQMNLALILASDQPQGSVAVAKALEVDVQLTSTKKINIIALSELSQYKIGKIAGGKYDKSLHYMLQEEHFTPLHSYQQGLELLEKNRLDAILGLAYSINEAVEKYATQPALLHHQNITKEEVWLYASPSFNTNSSLILDIQNSMQEMISKGELNDIARRNHIKAKKSLTHEHAD